MEILSNVIFCVIILLHAFTCTKAKISIKDWKYWTSLLCICITYLCGYYAKKYNDDIYKTYEQILSSFFILVFIISFCISFISCSIAFFVYKGKIVERDKNIKMIEDAISDISCKMYIDKEGNNVLNGGSEEYESKWKYEIGYNTGLSDAIKLLKFNIENEIKKK